MAKKLILYGASNFGDEMVQLFRDINKANLTPIWEIAGFLDDNDAMAGKIRNGIPVLGTKSWLEGNDISEYYFVCCIGSPRAKSKIVSYLKSKNAKFATGIHPSVIMSDTSVVGEGTVITAGNIITTNIIIGNHIIVNLACTIGHYSNIGDYCTINPGVNISGDVILEEGVSIGTNATLLEKRKVGSYSIVGAGSVVNKDLPSNVTAVGVPAKVIKTLD
ncbi:MAG: acetyltransferase [Bacteroidota bacterium]